MKLTPWFDTQDVPVRSGVYNVSCEKEGQSGNWFAYIKIFPDGSICTSAWRRNKDVCSDYGLDRFYRGFDYFEYVASWRGVLND